MTADKQILGYLSGAPRVSTRDNASLGAPRAHILGVIKGFESLGWDVRQYIAGDRVPESWVSADSEREFTSSRLKVLGADVVRLGMGLRARRTASRSLGGVTMVYERFAALQSLGEPFKRAGIPWVLETQAPLFYEAKADRNSLVLVELAKRMELAAYRRCDALVCVTETLKDIIVAQAKIPHEKVLVVPNGVDLGKFDPLLYGMPDPNPVFTVGFVGGLFKWQGMDALVRALAILRKEGKHLRVVIVGDGSMRKSIQDLAAQLGVGEFIELVGHVPGAEVPAQILGFDVCFSGQVPHGIGQMYGSPMKLYEYMAMGRPVIASAYEDARRLILDRQTGFLFEPESLDSLLLALREAYSHGDLRTMGMRARETILARHSWKSRVAGLLESISPILTRSKKK